MTGTRNRWLPVLTEAAATPEQPERRQLTQWGQGLLAVAILRAGLGVYGGAWVISLRMSSRGELCLRLPTPEEAKHDDPHQYQLLRQYQLGMTLIEQLPAATPGQRLRLGEQLNGLVRELDSSCRLIFYYTNEQAALLTLATAAATLILLVVVLVAPEGLQSVNRTQRTVFIAASGLLALTLNFLQLGEQQTNSNLAETNYHGHDALLQRLNSSLANQRLEPGIAAAGASDALRTADAVALLIRGIDSQRLAMPDPRLQLSDSVAEEAWGRLLGNPPPTAGRSAPAGARAARPAASPGRGGGGCPGALRRAGLADRRC
jgi:hypothetical protein